MQLGLLNEVLLEDIGELPFSEDNFSQSPIMDATHNHSHTFLVEALCSDSTKNGGSDNNTA
jgi:hypothetical protein